MDEKITRQTLIELNEIAINDNNEKIKAFELEISKIQHEIDNLKYTNERFEKYLKKLKGIK